MATLQIENLPDDVYRSLQDLANQKNFTLNEVVVHLLQQAFQSPAANAIQEQPARPIDEVLDKIRSRPRMNPIDFGLLDSTLLIRDDRNR